MWVNENAVQQYSRRLRIFPDIFFCLRRTGDSWACTGIPQPAKLEQFEEVPGGLKSSRLLYINPTHQFLFSIFMTHISSISICSTTATYWLFQIFTYAFLKLLFQCQFSSYCSLLAFVCIIQLSPELPLIYVVVFVCIFCSLFLFHFTRIYSP